MQPTPGVDPIFELENQAKSCFERKDWAAARNYLEKALAIEMSPLRRVQVLRNVLLTYIEENDREHGLMIANQALEIINAYKLNESSNEGAVLRGLFRGSAARFSGTKPGLFAFAPFGPALAGYMGGAAIGSAIGSQIVVNSFNLQGPIRTDLRYGSAALGALIGFFVFTRPFVIHPRLAWIVSLACTALIVKILLQDDAKKGLFTLALVLAVPIMFSIYGFLIYRRGRS